MTLPTFLQMKHKRSRSTFWVTFRRTVAGGFPLPLLLMLALCLMIPLLVNFISGTLDKEIRAGISYMLISNPSPMNESILLAIGISACLLSIWLFRFIINKRTLNVYYSLGVTRTELFLSNYTAGATMLFTAIGLPVLLDILVNIRFYGSSYYLWTSALHLLVGLFLFAMVCFTITAAVFSLVGTIPEAVGFTVILLAAPSMVAHCIQCLMRQFVWGSSYGITLPVIPGTATNYNAIEQSTIFAASSSVNPLVFMRNPMYDLAQRKADGTLEELGAVRPWIAPNWLELLPWVLVVLALAAAGLYLFKRRRAEISGFIGINKPLNTICTFLLAFTGMCAVADALITLSNFSPVWAYVIGAIVFLFIYLLIDLILIRNFRSFLRGLKKLPLHAAAVALLFLLFAVGFHGYETRVPDVDQIQTAYISNTANYNLYGNMFHSNGGFSAYDDGTLMFGERSLLGGFTSTEDKTLIHDLHQKLIDGKKQDGKLPARIVVAYQTESGAILTRIYNYATPDTLADTLQVHTSQWARDAVEQAFFATPAKEPSRPDYGDMSLENTSNTYVQYENARVSLVNRTLDQYTPLSLTREQFDTLKRAVVQDLNAQTVQQRFFPKLPILGFVRFASPDNQDSEFITINSNGIVPITTDMKQTLGYLQTHGWKEAFHANSQTFRRGFVSRFADSSLLLQNSISGTSYGGRSWFGTPIVYTKTHYFGGSAAKINDEVMGESWNYNNRPELTAEQFGEILPKLQMAYYTKGEGYNVVYETADNFHIVAYLPQQDAPQWLADMVK